MKPTKFLVLVDEPSLVAILQTRLGEEYLVIASPFVAQHIAFIAVPQS
jgi:hypothetical protein